MSAGLSKRRKERRNDPGPGDTAEPKIPDGPVVKLTRIVEAAASGDGSGGSMMNEIARAVLPGGVPTRFEPMGESLEALLGAGWTLDGASGSHAGAALLLRKGSANALCFLVPVGLAEGASALSDCRRLN